MNSGDDYKHSQDESVRSDSKDSPGKSGNGGSEKPESEKPETVGFPANDGGEMDSPSDELPTDVVIILTPQDLRILAICGGVYPFVDDNGNGIGRITDIYGADRGSHEHGGVDIAVPVGTNVRASMDARVAEVIMGDTIHGNRVTIEFDDGTKFSVSHLSSIETKKGAELQAGQVYAKTGNSGKSTGPHAHTEYYVNGKKEDPMKFLFRGAN
ncbi:MAG: M23 family metallopeptidase [Spirochaetales bacterium]|nr:M23 family metallopeptidase [Spirochaetales bacterium]